MVGDELVAHLEIVLGRCADKGWVWRLVLAGLSVGAAAGHDLGVYVEQAAVGVQQRFLVGDELVAYLNVALASGLLSGRGPRRRYRCCQNGRDQKYSNSPLHSGQHYPSSAFPAGEAEAVADGPHGGDEAGVLFAQLGPQTADVDIHGAGAAEVVVAPYPAEQRLTGEHLAG